MREQEDPSSSATPVASENLKVDLNALQGKFEAFCKNQESMVSILNVKLIKQRFADFQTKLKIWRGAERQRKRRKKQFKRHAARLTEVLEYQAQTFQNDVQLVNDCNSTYNDFQDYLRKCYKNEKTLNSFLAGLPEN